MKLREDTIRIQEELGAYCRTGKEADLPGITPGRVHHYRRLISNAVSDTLQTAFPIARIALGDENWNTLVEDFLSGGLPQTPQLWMLPLEFYRYHVSRESGNRMELPFLDDLLYFEWMEIEIHTMPDRPTPDFLDKGNLFLDRLAFNPEHEIVKLEYPVHLYPAQESIAKKGEYYVLIYRIPVSGQVQFLDLSPLHVYIITRLQEEAQPLREIKHEFARVAGIESLSYLDDALSAFLGDLLERKMILGFIKQ
jgi:hypothetical protein